MRGRRRHHQLRNENTKTEECLVRLFTNDANGEKGNKKRRKLLMSSVWRQQQAALSYDAFPID